jgi:TolA-binding protein
VPVLAEATFWLGYCHEKQQQTDEAARYYRKIVNDYKDTPAARKAEERLNNIGGKIV